MAKVNSGPIPDINEDWGKASSDGLPYSGESVQKFIKEGLKKADDALEGKIGYSFFNQEDATLYHFKDEESYRAWIDSGEDTYILSRTPISFEGKLHQIEISPVAPSSKEMYFTKNAVTNIVTTKVESFSKALTDKTWETVDEYIEVSVFIDKGGIGNYQQIKTLEVISGKNFSIDVKNYIASGYNRLKISAVGKDTGTVTNFVYTINLTSMYLSPSNFDYATPFIEGQPYHLGGMNIGGDLDKTLHIKVTRDEIYTKKYEVFLGSATYPTFAYTFDELEFPVVDPSIGATGVYHVDIWLEAFGVKSDTLSYNIICVSADKEKEAQVVSISEVPPTLSNYDNNTLFYYCVYNKGDSKGSPKITLEAVVNNNQIWSLEETQIDVATAKAIPYEKSIEIESVEDNIQLSATVSYGNVQQAIYHLDNSKSYPAEQDKLKFYINPAMRANTLDNKDKIINAVNSTAYNAEWTKMSWVEDGWVTDNPNPTVENPGRACLFIPAYSKVNIDYQPFANISSPITLEFAYKVTNSSDYTDPIITICDDLNNSKFTGIKITPKNVLVHSAIKNELDSQQDYNLIDEEFIHLVITIIPNYNTNYGNICQIYCNGAKVRSFEFSSIQEWDNSANIILGNNTADLYLYKLRVYSRSFDKGNVRKNYLNSLDNKIIEDIKETTETLFKSCTDDSGSIDYNTCVNNGYNTMIIEMLGGDPLPDKLHQDKGQCNLTINIHDIPEGELDDEMEELLTGKELLNQDIEGQGTTAMTYTRWNFRWKLGSTYGKRRITAKKNVASSMHSHKMGATRLFNYLHTKCVGKNEAGGNIAVYQYPVFGFQKVKKEGTFGTYEYKFIGLYTIGPDKGDKKTFSYNDERYKESIIHMEGSDHTPKSVGFDYPWEYVNYEHEQERGINTYDAGLGAIQPDGHITVAWEVGMVGEYETDNPSHNTSIKNLLDSEFEPAYKVVYENSPLILGTEETLENINANITNWQSNISPEGDKYDKYEFWLKSDYNLYFYNQQSKQYEPTGVNMLEDLKIEESSLNGKSIDEINRIFINAREERFKANWEKYWHKEDCIFYYTFVLLLGLTDNFKKNTYPYKFPLLAEGGKWRWRGDDFDTLFDINNQGLASKKYSILVGEKDASGSIYAGDNSAFFKLIKNTQKENIKNMVNAIFSYMVNHPKSSGANTQEKLVSCIKYFFWDFAQNYFPPSAYNADSEWTYEEPWADKSGNSWKEVNPLNQSLGGHYEAEKDWVAMRMLFCSSYFNFGAFQAAGYADTSTGQLNYDGAAITNDYKIKAAIDFNPTVIIGGSETVSYGEKVPAGTVVDMPITGGDNTRVYIQGLDWITDLGDLSKFTISSKNPSLTIASKRLQRIKLGDEDVDLMSNHIANNSTIRSITFGSCPSLESIDLQNLSTLSGSIDLTQMPRLQKALLKGTSITELKLPSGAKLDTLQLPNTLNTLVLKNLKFLTAEGLDYDNEAFNNTASITIEGCDNIDSFALLRSAYESNAKLKYIRLVGFNTVGTADDITMLANIAKNKNSAGEDWDYKGLDNSGNIIEQPVLEGTIRVQGYIYEDDKIALNNIYKESLKIEAEGYYVRFEDKAFNDLVSATPENGGYGDGYGVTQEQLDEIKSFNTDKFRNNKDIINLSDLYKFRNLTVIGSSAFMGCSNVKEVIFPKNITDVSSYSFSNISKLEKIIFPKDGKLTYIPANGFANSLIDRIYIPDSIKSLEAQCLFYNDSNRVISLVIGEGLTSCADNVIYRGKSIVYIKSIEQWMKISGVGSLLGSKLYLYNNIEEITEDKGIYGIITIDYNWDKLEQEKVLVTTEMVNEALQDESITEIKNRTFQNCTQLEGKLVIPDNITSIGDSAFSNCSRLVEVDILNGVKIINNAAFRENTNLTKLTLPQSIERIIGGTFYNNKNMTVEDVNLPNLVELGAQSFDFCDVRKISNLGKITTIGIFTFRDNKNLTSIVIPNSVTSIGNSAFYGCSSLTGELVIPNSVERIGNDVFGNCVFDKIVIEDPSKIMGSINSFGCKTKELYIDSIQSLFDSHIWAYGGYEDLAYTIYVNNSPVYEINLKYNGITTILGKVFKCSTIKKAIIDEGFTELASECFYGCKDLKLIDLPSTITKINNTSIYGDGFTLICRATVPPEAQLNGRPAIIYVPDESIEGEDGYKTATGWSAYADRIKPLSDYVES